MGPPERNTAILRAVFLGGGTRIFLILAVAACVGDAGAQIVSRDSVHLRPVGAAVRDTFVLGNKTLPLPEGEFVLAAVELHDSRFVRGDFARQQHKMVDVALAQMVDRKLRAFVWASTVLKHGGTTGWVTEPCKRQDVLFKQSRVPFMKTNYEQNCLLVNQAGSLGSNAQGAYVTLAEWARSQGVSTPLPTVIDAAIARISVADYLVVRYVFNADAYGCVVRRGEPSPLVTAVIEFGKAMQVAVNEGFIGRRESVASLAAGAPQPQDCGATERAKH